MAIFKPAFICYFCKSETETYIEIGNYFYCADCDRERRTLLNKKTGKLLMFENVEDMKRFINLCKMIHLEINHIVRLIEFNQRNGEN